MRLSTYAKRLKVKSGDVLKAIAEINADRKKADRIPKKQNFSNLTEAEIEALNEHFQLEDGPDKSDTEEEEAIASAYKPGKQIIPMSRWRVTALRTKKNAGGIARAEETVDCNDESEAVRLTIQRRGLKSHAYRYRVVKIKELEPVEIEIPVV